MWVQEEHGHFTAAAAAVWLDQAIISTLSPMSSDLPEINRHCHKTSWTCNLHPCSTSKALCKQLHQHLGPGILGTASLCSAQMEKIGKGWLKSISSQFLVHEQKEQKCCPGWSPRRRYLPNSSQMGLSNKIGNLPVGYKVSEPSLSQVFFQIQVTVIVEPHGNSSACALREYVDLKSDLETIGKIVSKVQALC